MKRNTDYDTNRWNKNDWGCGHEGQGQVMKKDRQEHKQTEHEPSRRRKKQTNLNMRQKEIAIVTGNQGTAGRQTGTQNNTLSS